MKNSLFLGILFFSFVTVYSQTQSLTPIGSESKIHFTINNFGISTGGDIGNIKGHINFNAKDPTASSADVTVDVSTIDTDNERRDKHLLASDFFNVAKYPTIRITSTNITPGKLNDTYIFTGNLTIKAVTKTINFPFSIIPQNDGYLMSGNFKINRLDFAVGGESMTMSDEIAVSLKVFAK